MGFNKNNLIFLYFCLNLFLFTKYKLFNLIFINPYGGIFFWHTAQILNNLQLNLVFIFILVILILEIYNVPIKKCIYYLPILIYFLNFYFNSHDIVLYCGDLGILFKKLNNALLNGLLVIHPWLTFILYGYIFFTLHYYVNNIKIYKILFLKNNLKYSYINYIIYAIMLGSWWSYQELSWGGWWNWDVVELLSLNFFFICLLLSHSTNIGVFLKKYTLIKFVLIFLLSLIIIRFNLLSSIHAFTNLNLFKILFIKFIIILFYLVNFTYVLIYIFFKNRYVKTSLTYLIYFNLHICIIILIITIYIITLIFFKIDFLELNIFFEFFFLYLLGYFLISFTKIKYNNINIIYLNLFINNYIYFISTLIFNNRFKNLKRIINTNLKYHLVFIIAFIIVYFLKIYFISISIFLEYHFVPRSLIKAYNYNHFSNIFYNTNLNFLFNNFIYTSTKFFNFSEIKIHYYKNFLLNLYSFFIKIIQPNENIFLLIYKNFFLIFLILQILIFINKFFKTIKIN